MAFCELRPVTEAQDVARVALGSVYAFADIVERSRGTRHNPGDKVNRPWFPGVVLKSDTDSGANKAHVTFSFNHKNQGWNYAWQGQTRRPVQHELHMFILAGPMNTSKFTVVCELSSSSFCLQTRRQSEELNAAGYLVNINNINNNNTVISSVGSSQTARAGTKRSAAQMTGSPVVRPSPTPAKRLTESTLNSRACEESSYALDTHPPVDLTSDMTSESIAMRIKLLEARRQELVQQEGQFIKSMTVCNDPVMPVEALRHVTQTVPILTMPVACSPKTHLIVPALVPAVPDPMSMGGQNLDAVSLDMLQRIAQAACILKKFDQPTNRGGTAEAASTLAFLKAQVLAS
jgi:hypothetical protein